MTWSFRDGIVGIICYTLGASIYTNHTDSVYLITMWFVLVLSGFTRKHIDR